MTPSQKREERANVMAELAQERLRLARMRFHWSVWKGEAKAFWGRAVLTTTLLTWFILFQWGANPPYSLGISYCYLPFAIFTYLFSWLLLGFLGFRLIDLLRHRIPEEFDPVIHREEIKVGGRPIPLKDLGQTAWRVIPAIGALIGLALIVTGWHLFIPLVGGGVVWSCPS
jgi:hypothetical protein